MTIEVTQLPETKVWTDRFKQYKMTYPNGYPVQVRRITNCANCGIEIGGFFGNRVYRFGKSDLCKPCGEGKDPIAQMSIAQTGMTPDKYQRNHRRAWNE